MIPTKKQWQNWSLPNKYTAISLLIAVAMFAFYTIEKSAQVTKKIAPQETWYLGEWVVDIEASKPEFIRMYSHYEEAFTPVIWKLMSWPPIEEILKDAVFYFDEDGGQQLKTGHFNDYGGSSTVENFELPIGESISLIGDAEIDKYYGETSVVTYDIRLVSKNKVRLAINKHDMRLPECLSDAVMPDFYLKKEKETVYLTSYYFIFKDLENNILSPESACNYSIEFFPTRWQLTRKDSA